MKQIVRYIEEPYSALPSVLGMHCYLETRWTVRRLTSAENKQSIFHNLIIDIIDLIFFPEESHSWYVSRGPTIDSRKNKNGNYIEILKNRTMIVFLIKLNKN